MERKTARIQMVVTPSQKARIEALANRMEKTISQMILDLVNKEVKNGL